MLGRLFAVGLSVVCLSLLPSPAQAGTEREQLLDQALQISQAQRTMEVIGAALDRNIQASPQFSQLEERVRDRIAEVFRRAFAPQKYVQSVRTLLSERMTDEALRSYVTAMQTPISLKALQFELASALATPEQIQEYAKLASKESEYGDRLVLLKRLDESSGGSEMMLAITMHSILSSAEMIRRIEALRGSPLPPRGQPGGTRRAPVSKAEFTELANSIRPRVRRESLETMLFVYQSLTKAELNQYTELAELAPMRSAALAMNDALGALFFAAQKEAFDNLMLEMQGQGERSI